MNNRKTERIIASLMTLVFVASLIPIFWLAFYDHPCADDFSYGLRPHLTWVETGSILQVLTAAVNKVIERYQNWQGTFSSIFLMAVQPAVFGDSYYIVTPFLMVGMLSFGTFSFLGELMLGFLKSTKAQFLLVACGLLTVSIQLMVSPVEGIFWFNGAVHYVFMYACLLLMLACVLHHVRTDGKFHLVAACFLAVVVGGGNYITALASILCIGILGFFQLLYRKKIKLTTGILLAFAILGFGISAVAPGNQIRQEYFEKNSLAGAILNSLRDTIPFIRENIGILYVLFLIFLIPFLVRFLSSCKCKFRFPLLVPLVSFCLVSAMFSPTEYSLQTSYIGRTANVILLMIQLLGVLNEIYLLGWLVEKLKGHHTKKAVGNEKKIWVFTVVMGMLALGTVLATYRSEVVYTSITALLSLRSGEVAQYDASVRERLELLESGEKQKLVLEPLAAHPYLLYFDDITDDKKDWRNTSMAKFYGQKSVTLAETPEDQTE